MSNQLHQGKPTNYIQSNSKLFTGFFLPAHPQRKEEGGLRTKGLFKNSSKEYPLISIITVVFNGAKHIEQTIQSIINQSYNNVEYIIIDGDSKDNTVDIIKKYEDKVDYWVSEPDKGITDAWNKGLAVATGEIIGFLNAGDFFDLNCFQEVIEKLPIDKLAFSYGETRLINETEQIVKVINTKFNSQKIYSGFRFYHPGCFATRKTFEAVGRFNNSYRIAMDCDWLMRCYLKGVIFQYIGNICYMRTDGISNTFNLIAYGEYVQALKNNGFSEFRIYLSMIAFASKALIKLILQKV